MNLAITSTQELHERLDVLINLHDSLRAQGARGEAQSVLKELRGVQFELLLRNQKEAA